MIKKMKIIVIILSICLLQISCRSNVEKNKWYIDIHKPIIDKFYTNPTEFFNSKDNAYPWLNEENLSFFLQNFSGQEYSIANSQLIPWSILKESGVYSYFKHVITIENPKTNKKFYFTISSIDIRWKLIYAGHLDPTEFGKKYYDGQDSPYEYF